MSRIRLPRFLLRRKAPHRVPRRLVLEPLDHRLVLTGVVEVVTDPPLAGTTETEIVDPAAPLVDEPASDTCEEPAVPVDGEPVDDTTDNLGDVETPTVEVGDPPPEPEMGPEEGGPGAADPDSVGPVIEQFDATYEALNDEWVITGKVVDDQSVAGLTVQISGLAEGLITTNTDGTFILRCQIPPGCFGCVTAVATDSDGNPSSPASVWIST